MKTMTMTMLIREFSDLHQEFNPYIVEPMSEDKDTILILAGDIHVGTTATEFVRQMADSFAHVIYILGNHEFYQNEMVSLPDRIREALEDIENVRPFSSRPFCIASVTRVFRLMPSSRIRNVSTPSLPVD